MDLLVLVVLMMLVALVVRMERCVVLKQTGPLSASYFYQCFITLSEATERQRHHMSTKSIGDGIKTKTIKSTPLAPLVPLAPPTPLASPTCNAYNGILKHSACKELKTLLVLLYCPLQYDTRNPNLLKSLVMLMELVELLLRI